jgi:hypothetical protein
MREVEDAVQGELYGGSAQARALQAGAAGRPDVQHQFLQPWYVHQQHPAAPATLASTVVHKVFLSG